MRLFEPVVRANGDVSTKDFTLPRTARGFLAKLDVSAVTATPTVNLKFQYFDEIRQEFEDLVGGTGGIVVVAVEQATVVSEKEVTAYPGISPTVDTGVARKFSIGVPHKLRAVLTTGDLAGDDATASAVLIPLE